MEEIASERRAGPRAALISAWIASLALVACGQPREASLTGYVEGEYLRVAAPFAGTLQQISVRRGDSVKAGAPLFALERENETAARREAEERLRGAEARFTNLQTGKRPPEVEMIAEQLQQARAARDLSAANLTRQQKLFAQGFISSAALDDVRTAAKRDEARVAELEASVTTTKLHARNDEIRAAEADAHVHWIVGDVTKLGILATPPGYSLIYDIGCIQGLPDEAAALQAIGLRRSTDVVGGFQAWRRARLMVGPPGVVTPPRLSPPRRQR